MLKRLFAPVVVMMICALLAACGSKEKPLAEQAIKAAEEALNSVKSEAVKYVPDQMKSVEDAIKAAKASFDKGDYPGALNAAKDLPAKAKDLAKAAADKKAELTKKWEELSANLPKMVEAIKSRVDILSQSKKLPAGMDQATLDGAKTGLASIDEIWTQATEAFKGGNLTDALAKAGTVKDKAAGIMTSLGMEVPEGAKG
jgi:colicin import membrane protein